MNLDQVISFIRAIQRPIAIFLIISTIIGLAIYLVVKFHDATMARDVLVFILGCGGTVVGFLFGERAAKKTGVT